MAPRDFRTIYNSVFHFHIIDVGPCSFSSPFPMAVITRKKDIAKRRGHSNGHHPQPNDAIGALKAAAASTQPKFPRTSCPRSLPLSPGPPSSLSLPIAGCARKHCCRILFCSSSWFRDRGRWMQQESLMLANLETQRANLTDDSAIK